MFLAEYLICIYLTINDNILYEPHYLHTTSLNNSLSMTNIVLFDLYDASWLLFSVIAVCYSFPQLELRFNLKFLI